MKKIMTISFSFLLCLSVMAFAQPDKKEMEKMKKEQQEMTQLVEKYNKATSDKKKNEIKAQIQAKVAANYDKHIERMEERVKESQAKLDEAKVKLAQSKTPEYKAKHIDEITQDILSGKHKPMFGVPPNFKGGQKGIRGHKGFKKGCPFAKGFDKGEGKECPFMKDGAKEHKGCPCMKGKDKAEKPCPCMKDKNKEGKGCPCMKGPKAEILPVKPEVEKK